MKQNIENNYSTYLSLLKQLVSINSVYDNQAGILEALQFCKKHFEKYLKNYNCYFDNKNNLICQPKKVNNEKNILYLSAHMDTVPAEKNDWNEKYDPFMPFEEEKEIVGRGVNDCKAGVAYQLFLAILIAEKFPETTNIVFTISAREENGGDSAKEIALQIGEKLPVGKKTYLITLENNVTVNPPTLAVNYGERGSVALEVTATLDVIRNFLIQDENEWNPTIIKPLEDSKLSTKEHILQAGGHPASAVREKNKLYQLLIQKDSQKLVLEAGNERLISAIPTHIYKATTTFPIKHKVIFDLRNFKKIKDLVVELEKYHFSYRFVKKIDFGYDIKQKLFQDEIYQKMLGIKNGGIAIAFEINPGATDTGKIYDACSEKIKDTFLPITMGPGSRSQKTKIPPRLSHGINETYDKQSGLQAIIFISEVIASMNFFLGTRPSTW